MAKQIKPNEQLIETLNKRGRLRYDCLLDISKQANDYFEIKEADEVDPMGKYIFFFNEEKKMNEVLKEIKKIENEFNKEQEKYAIPLPIHLNVHKINVNSDYMTLNYTATWQYMYNCKQEKFTINNLINRLKAEEQQEEEKIKLSPKMKEEQKNKKIEYIKLKLGQDIDQLSSFNLNTRIYAIRYTGTKYRINYFDKKEERKKQVSIADSLLVCGCDRIIESNNSKRKDRIEIKYKKYYIGSCNGLSIYKAF